MRKCRELLANENEKLKSENKHLRDDYEEIKKHIKGLLRFAQETDCENVADDIIPCEKDSDEFATPFSILWESLEEEYERSYSTCTIN